METTLIILQIIFYAVASLAIIAFFCFIAIAAYRIIKILNKLQIIAAQAQEVSGEAKQKIEEIIENLSLLPIVSFFIKKQKKSRKNKQQTK